MHSCHAEDRDVLQRLTTTEGQILALERSMKSGFDRVDIGFEKMAAEFKAFNERFNALVIKFNCILAGAGVVITGIANAKTLVMIYQHLFA